jgi:carboxyl-terminal processing protease
MQSFLAGALRAALCRSRAASSAAMVLVLLAACGGGGGGDDGPREVPQSCSPNNPYRGDAGGPVVDASLAVEKQWVRAYMDDVYLWYREIPNANPADPLFSVDTPSGFYTSIENYFNALLSPELTLSGKFKDQFSFIYPARLWDEQINQGSTAGWGVEWHFDTFTTTNISGVKIAYVHGESPAEVAGLQRGDRLTSIDGLPATANSANAVNALLSRLYPAAGQQVEFVVARGAGNLSRTLTSAQVAITAVDHGVIDVAGGARVGYLLFNDHVLPSERPLIDAVTALKAQGINDLVLDLRYNSGGYVYLASELAYMIAGHARTENKIFEASQFNDKQSARNEATPFFNLGCVPDPATFVCSTDEQLPTLDLQTVYILTSADTCSASEAIINGLRGIDIDVRIVGGATCGKPYGSFGASNCGINYFPLEFKGINQKGYGDYADGFVPAATANATDRVRGCVVADDLTRALGDPAEGQLAAALYMRANNACPPIASPSRQDPLSASRATTPRVVKSVVLSNRIGRMPQR